MVVCATLCLCIGVRLWSSERYGRHLSDSLSCKTVYQNPGEGRGGGGGALSTEWILTAKLRFLSSLNCHLVVWTVKGIYERGTVKEDRGQSGYLGQPR